MSRIHLGAMNFGKRTDNKESEAIIKEAYERGVEWVDTANAYGDGVSEEVVGKVLKTMPEGGRPKVATKVGWMRRNGKFEGLSKARVLEAANESLRRLQMERVDLYYLHMPDDSTPIEETLDALQKLHEEKKIGGWGVSNYASWQILEMLPKAEERGLPPPAFSQILYNLLIRQVEIEHLRFLQRFSIPCVAYNPLAGGLLTNLYGQKGAKEKTYRFHKNPMYQRRYLTERLMALAEEFRILARKNSLSIIDLSYAWLFARPGVDAVLVGPGSMAHLNAAFDAAQIELAPAVTKEADAIFTSYLGTDAVYARS